MKMKKLELVGLRPHSRQWLSEFKQMAIITLEPRFNETLFNENLDITNSVLSLSNNKIGRKLDITNPRFNKRIWPVPSDFVKSRFHFTEQILNQRFDFFRVVSYLHRFLFR